MRSRLTPGRLILLLSFLLAARAAAFADAPAFDLAGPKVDVHVQRGGKTLPIGAVPNLLPGDRLWVHPDLPESQSAHYVLIVAFLRGSTNPPPLEWFKRVETWTKPVREEGVFVVVPAEAQQALIFLAPETIGDFSTLRKAVQGRPGAFVRATQDLQQASWDRLRLDAYLAEVKTLAMNELKDPKVLKERTELAARSLGIHIDQQCFDKPTEQQAPCLVQHTDGLVLDDSNAQSLVTQMASGSAADMMNQLSYSALGGAGQFSPYVGAVVDLARILSSIHTAKYQYIPALALPTREQKDTLNLRLNVPPSFRDPKSVIVVALPPIGPGTLPQMHPADLAQNPTQTYCVAKPGLTLSADGAPLVFATAMAHDLTLHLDTKAVGAATSTTPAQLTEPASSPVTSKSGSDPKPAKGASSPVPQSAPSGMDVAITPDPSQGGFVLEKPVPNLPENEVVGEIRGQWGFNSWVGPKFHLRTSHSSGWVIPSPDQSVLITGREDTLHIQGESTLCVSDVEAKIPVEGQNNPKAVKLSWKSPKPELIETAVPLKEAVPGTVTIAIHQYAQDKPDELSLKAYAEAAGLDRLTLSAGDKVAVLKGKRLDEVESADLAGITFVPAALNRVKDFDQLELSATGITATLQPGNGYSAKITLRDGRTSHVPATVGPSRPQIDLLSKGVQHDEGEAEAAPSVVRLGSTNDLPLQRRLVFFVRSRVPASFARTEKVEIAAVDGSFGTTLSLSDGSLMLEDTHTAVAVVDPLARFGASAFGPIQLRAITADGVTGDWVPLGTLVRLPGFSTANSLRCPRNPAKSCQLTGTNLFLVTAVSASPDMANAIDVPPEFAGNSLSVPNAARVSGSQNSGTLYLRLRDDPETIQTLNLPVISPASTGALAASEPAASQQPSNSGPSPNQDSGPSPNSGPNPGPNSGPNPDKGSSLSPDSHSAAAPGSDSPKPAGGPAQH